MLNNNCIILSLFLIPLISGFLCFVLPNSTKTKFRLMIGSVLLTAFLSSFIILKVLKTGPIFSSFNLLFLDSLSAYHLMIMMIVFTLSSFFSIIYFQKEAEDHNLNIQNVRRFTSLWLLSLAAMILVLISNNIAIMWIGIEAMTLITAFLICIHANQHSLEAMWKYIIICSVGMALAFIGTLFIAAATKNLPIDTNKVLLWTSLLKNAESLNPAFIKIGFIFIVIGYGTKAGLPPMHTWLPDAHSQAPAPVSALFSGFMLNTALYCIIRFIPIVNKVTAYSGWGLSIIMIFGLFSIIIAAAFILFQKNLKRLLAYSTVEHIGIISLGLGLGGLGTFAALFHILNHSLSKSLSFFAAGKLGQTFGTYNMAKIKNSLKINPVWGLGLTVGLLALIGTAPFSIFMSELLLIKAAINNKAWIPLFIFIFGSSIIFIGALKLIISMAWKEEKSTIQTKNNISEYLLVIILVAILLTLGLWIPSKLYNFITHASNIINGVN